MSRQKTAFLIFVASVGLFLAGLQNVEFTRINCRFALFVYEMMNGNLGPFPTLYGKHYCDYLSVHTYLMYLSSYLGGVSMLTVTLPSALAAAGVMTFTYLIGERMSHKFGLFAVILLACSYEFLCIARAPSPDMFVALASITAFYLMYTAELENKAARLFLLPLLFVFGFVMRGPIGAIIPIGVVFVFYLTARRWKTAVAGGVLGTLVLACCIMLLVIHIHDLGGRELFKEWQQAMIGSRMGNGKPFWFYFTNAVGSFSIGYPLALFVMGTYVWIKRKKYFSHAHKDSYSALRQHLTGWFFVIVIGMSIPGTKHLRYVTAALPAAALLAAFVFVNPDKFEIFKKVRMIFLKLCYAVPFLALIAIIGGAIVLRILKLDVPIPMFLPAIMFIILGFALISGTKKIKNLDKVMYITALTAVCFFVIKIMILEPLDTYLESSYKFVKVIEEKRPSESKICFLGIDKDNEALKYLVNILPKKKFYTPYFVGLHECEKLMELPDNTLIVVKKGKTIAPEALKHLKEVARGKLGHRKCVLYMLVK